MKKLTYLALIAGLISSTPGYGWPWSKSDVQKLPYTNDESTEKRIKEELQSLEQKNFKVSEDLTEKYYTEVIMPTQQAIIDALYDQISTERKKLWENRSYENMRRHHAVKRTIFEEILRKIDEDKEGRIITEFTENPLVMPKEIEPIVSKYILKQPTKPFLADVRQTNAYWYDVNFADSYNVEHKNKLAAKISQSIIKKRNEFEKEFSENYLGKNHDNSLGTMILVRNQYSNKINNDRSPEEKINNAIIFSDGSTYHPATPDKPAFFEEKKPTFLQKLANLFTQKPQSTIKPLAPSNTLSSTKQNHFNWPQANWQKIRQYTPVMPSKEKMLERAKNLREARYEIAPNSAEEALEQAEDFGIGYQ